MIEVEGLCKKYGGRAVLDGVTFAVPEGEALALVGANGSGKTVLLRILATLERADGGDVRVGGLAVGVGAVGGAAVDRHRAEVRALIGWMPEVSGVQPGVTALEDVAFYAGVHGLDRKRRVTVAGELLELVGLADRGDEDVAQLTRGQRQRLGLARALVHDPAVLLLDDPLGLDAQAQADLADLVGELRAMGKTIVVSGHDLGALEQMCTWAGVLHRGKMVATGPMADVRGESPSLKDAVLSLTGAGGSTGEARGGDGDGGSPPGPGPGSDHDANSDPGPETESPS